MSWSRFFSMMILLGLMVVMHSEARRRMRKGPSRVRLVGRPRKQMAPEGSPVKMRTTGGEVQGMIQKGVKRFVGIPFAKPPVGDLRFKHPVKAEPWKGVKDATKLPNSCWQLIDEAFEKFRGVDMWNPNTPRSEDCLYLNVWTPQSGGRHPIIVWIFGGGFWSGSSTLDSYNPSALVELQDVIVVGMNYRVGPFGFLYDGGDGAPGNAGMRDQVMAMQWVKDNAAFMGGDPDRITIMGESAGGASVGYHLLSPLSKHLFNYGIMMSGGPLVDWGIQSHDKALSRFKVMADSVECKEGDNDAVTKCLLKVDAEALTTAQWNVVDGTYFDPPFGLITGDSFLPEDPAVMMAKGMSKKTPVISGVVANEGIYWLLYGFPDVFKKHDPNPVNEEQFHEVLSGILKQQKIETPAIHNFTSLIYRDTHPEGDRPSNLRALDYASGDILFKCSSLEFATQHSQQGGETYVYSFNHRTQDMPWPKYIGVAHGYEITTFFGRPFLNKQDFSDFDRQASFKTMFYVGNFARTGNPNTSQRRTRIPQWPSWDKTSEEFMNLESTPSGGKGLRHAECAYWKEGVPILEAK